MKTGDPVIVRYPGARPEPATLVWFGGTAVGCWSLIDRAGHRERIPTAYLRRTR